MPANPAWDTEHLVTIALDINKFPIAHHLSGLFAILADVASNTHLAVWMRKF